MSDCGAEHPKYGVPCTSDITHNGGHEHDSVNLLVHWGEPSYDTEGSVYE